MLLMLITEKQDLEKAQVFAERRSCLITGKTDPVTYNTQIDLWIEEARERPETRDLANELLKLKK